MPLVNNNRKGVVSACERCGNATECARLNPYGCRDFYPSLNTNFDMSREIDVRRALEAAAAG